MANRRERERQLARRRYERRRQREIERQRRRRRLAAISGIVVAGLAAAGGAAYGISTAVGGRSSSTLSQSTSTPTPTSSAPTPFNGTCTYSPAGKAARPVGTPPQKNVPHMAETATFTTNRGPIKIALNGAAAPCTVNSFAYLAAKHYFDNTSCHRLTTSGIYVLQCGDPTGTGSGGPGYQFGDENLAAFGAAGADGTVTYPAGTLAMANAGPGTNGSQFFLVYQDSPLAPSYTPFGRITTGIDVLKKVAAAGSTPAGDGKPKLPLTIKQVVVTRT